jgi:hypothetical protein
MLRDVEVCLHYRCAFVAGAGTLLVPYVDILCTLCGLVMYVINLLKPSGNFTYHQV